MTYCDNYNCIYENNGTCSLPEITVNFVGWCECCVIDPLRDERLEDELEARCPQWKEPPEKPQKHNKRVHGKITADHRKPRKGEKSALD